MQSQNTLERCLPDSINVSYVDNNSTIEEALKRMTDAALNTEDAEAVSYSKFFNCQVFFLTFKQYFLQKKLSEAYLDENKISNLIEYLFNKLILKQPEDPIAFLLDSLEEIKSKKQEQLIQKKEIETMFDLIDINSKGYITLDQLLKSLENLQVDQKEIDQAKEKAGSKKNFNKEEFYSILVDGLNILKDSPYN